MERWERCGGVGRPCGGGGVGGEGGGAVWAEGGRGGVGGGGFGHALEACSKNFLSTSEWSDGSAGVWVGAVRGWGCRR